MFSEPFNVQTGTPPGNNHPLSHKLRNGPIDTWIYNLHYRSNPDIIAEEMYKKDPHGASFPEVQQNYAQRFQTSQVKRELELFGTERRGKIFLREDVSPEFVPTFVHYSNWFKEAVESNFRLTGRERLLPNNTRTYYY